MKLSLITINRNNVEGLRKTIKSVIAQTLDGFEYIVIDGASTDGSVDVIKQYENKISYWVSEPDKGIYNAMNKGIARAQGEYVLFLNSGDYLVDKNVLVNVVAYELKEDIVYGEQLVEKNGSLQKTLFLEPESISFYSFIKSSLPHQCTFIRKNLFDKIGLYNESNKIVSDWEFNMLALFKYNVLLRKINCPIAVYDSTGISSDVSLSKIHQEEKKRVLYTYFPRIMKDVESLEALKRSRLYRILEFCRKLKNLFL